MSNEAENFFQTSTLFTHTQKGGASHSDRKGILDFANHQNIHLSPARIYPHSSCISHNTTEVSYSQKQVSNDTSVCMGKVGYDWGTLQHQGYNLSDETDIGYLFFDTNQFLDDSEKVTYDAGTVVSIPPEFHQSHYHQTLASLSHPFAPIDTYPTEFDLHPSKEHNSHSSMRGYNDTSLEDLDETLEPKIPTIDPKRLVSVRSNYTSDSTLKLEDATAFIPYMINTPERKPTKGPLQTKTQSPVASNKMRPAKLEKSNKIQRRVYVKPFIQYCNEVRTTVRRTYPFVSNNELMKIIGKKWAALSPQEKAQYRIERTAVQFHPFQATKEA